MQFGVEETVENSIFKVVGIGGGGNNAIKRMLEVGLDASFVAINTDQQVLDRLEISNKITIGRKTTGGLGAGGIPEKGRESAEENAEDIKAAIKGSKMLFLTAGMGGGTGTGAIPIVAKIAKEMGILTVGVVTLPFAFELERKMNLAMDGLEKLKAEVDTIIVVPSEAVRGIISKASVEDSFRYIDDVLANAVRSILNILQNVGEINIDFNDVFSIMQRGGTALMGLGRGRGEQRVTEAVTEAINNPLISHVSIAKATRLLVSATVSKKFPMDEFTQMINLVVSNIEDKNVWVIPGLFFNDAMGENVELTVLATGMSEGEYKPKSEEVIIDEEVPQDPNVVSTNEMSIFSHSFGDGGEKKMVSPDNDNAVPEFLRAHGRYIK